MLNDDQRQSLCKRFGMEPAWRKPGGNWIDTYRPEPHERADVEYRWPAIDSDPRECEKLETAIRCDARVASYRMVTEPATEHRGEPWLADALLQMLECDQWMWHGQGEARSEAVCAAIWTAFAAGEFDG